MKITLLVLLSIVSGALVGMVEVHSRHSVWPLVLGLSLVAGLVLSLGRIWVWLPIEQLLNRLGRIGSSHRPLALPGLPLDRTDEVGQLARALHNLSTWAIRDHHDATQLRRTLDDRIEKETRKATHQLSLMAMRDPLTNLANRRYLEANLEPLVQSCQAQGRDLVCIGLDIDNFKQVNDRLGHAHGDALLAMLGGIIRASIRDGDDAIRLGGDELVVLLPGCTLKRARHLADGLFALFRQHVGTNLPSDLNVDLSIGASSLQRDQAPTGAELLSHADANLYLAKHAGKGRCVGL